MSITEKHPDWDQILTISPDALAEALGNLKYDQLAAFLGKLSAKISTDAEKDRQRGRTLLALNLFRAANHLEQSSSAVDKAWKVCKPHMTPNDGPAPAV